MPAVPPGGGLELPVATTGARRTEGLRHAPAHQGSDRPERLAHPDRVPAGARSAGAAGGSGAGVSRRVAPGCSAPQFVNQSVGIVMVRPHGLTLLTRLPTEATRF